jgi:hypothetical protein
MLYLVMLFVIMLNVVKLSSVIMMKVVLLSVMMLNVFMLRAIMVSVAAPKRVFYTSLFNVKLLLLLNLNLKNKKVFFISRRVEIEQETTMSKWTRLGKAGTFDHLLKQEKFWVLGAGF